jgi:hypothetical protein
MPVKAQNSVKIVERYYSPLHRIYYIIITELLNISKDIALCLITAPIIPTSIYAFSTPSAYLRV